MYEKRIKIDIIMNSISSCTEMNFQDRMCNVLDIVYSGCGFKFEKVQPSNGDAKNDGWIVEKNIYFAMFSPNDSKISQNAQIVKKLEDDLDGLCNHVYNNGKWGKKINGFYLIVNTHDKDLPADPDRLRENKIKEIKKKYGKEFKAEVISIKDIRKQFLDIDIQIIDRIMKYLEIDGANDEFSTYDVAEFVNEYAGYLATKKIQIVDSDYKKISTDKKIKINNLDNLRERIYSLIDASGKIDAYVSYVLSEEALDISKYENVKNYIVSEYKDLSKYYSGEELYCKLVEKIQYDNMNPLHIKILEPLIVNIFIRCDIFEKE